MKEPVETEGNTPDGHSEGPKGEGRMERDVDEGLFEEVRDVVA